MEERTRKILMTLFFIAAAVAGVEGIWQYFKLGIRSQGSLPHAILYAETLALACGSAIVMLFYQSDDGSRPKIVHFFLLVTVLITLAGILFSESRGVWIALIVAGTGTLFLYDRRKSLIFLSCIIVMLSITFYYSAELRGRATLIVTSVYHEDPTINASTATRFELWKGALMIFKEHPLVGSGAGNFESSIKRLNQGNKLKETVTMVHAHNIFLQALATRGIIGFVILVMFLVALMTWGMNEIKSHEETGGYVIIFCTLLMIVGGLTEDNLGTTKYFAAYFFTIGLIGPSGLIKENFSVT
jgi:O-antigen ligase